MTITEDQLDAAFAALADPTRRAIVNRLASGDATVNELAALSLIPKASAQVRIYPAVPLFKLYIINSSETFFGYYPIREHVVELGGEPTPMWDLMGKDAELFHDAVDTDTDARGSHYVKQSQMWFDSVWTSVARQLTSS